MLTDKLYTFFKVDRDQLSKISIGRLLDLLSGQYLRTLRFSDLCRSSSQTSIGGVSTIYSVNSTCEHWVAQLHVDRLLINFLPTWKINPDWEVPNFKTPETIWTFYCGSILLRIHPKWHSKIWDHNHFQCSVSLSTFNASSPVLFFSVHCFFSRP